uniref:Uncharacterized protein n=1 Tax=Bacteriophage sp. TaxID=38018 RepID=A0A8D9UHV1_9VIRU|nr:MAG TPA: Protein of unknown function (DUF2599) [Bacteriophage sp.]
MLHFQSMPMDLLIYIYQQFSCHFHILKLQY